MCGVFGFISKANKGPDLQVLRVLAKATESRGPHAFGFAWIDDRGRLRSFKQEGRITEYLPILDMLKNARAVIGHCRYATHGKPAENINNHPHPCDGGWLVHNGVIRNYLDLLAEREYWPTSECDSEVLGLLVEDSERDQLLLRCVDAVDQTTGSVVMLGLWPGKHGSRLVTVRRDNPLHTGTTGKSVYFASLRTGLPGKVEAVEEGRAIEYRHQADGSVKMFGASVLGRAEVEEACEL